MVTAEVVEAVEAVETVEAVEAVARVLSFPFLRTTNLDLIFKKSSDRRRKK